MPNSEVRTIIPVGIDQKGSKTWEWHLTDGNQITYYIRNRSDSPSKAHFHKGEDPSKNPERFLLLSGVVFFEFVNILGHYSSIELTADTDIKSLTIYPNMLHRMTVKTPFCQYIEYRTNYFNPKNPDTYPADQFPNKNFANW